MKLKSWANFFKNSTTLIFNSIQKYEPLKIALLLMLVGGVEKKVSEKQIFRNNINISLLSPPDIILRNLYKELQILNPEIIYSNASTSTASGLTASIIRDPETMSLCIESGLFTKKNENLFYIENFHNLEYRNQKLITECMENQEFGVNKAELKLKLNSKISILGVSEVSIENANNFQFFSKTRIFEKNLLGKFDLNFFLLWTDNIDYDFSISKRIILMQSEKKTKRNKNNIWSTQLYIQFVRNLSPLVKSKIYDFILKIYLSFKKIFSTKINTGIEISSRQLETLIRLSEAFAKLTLFPIIQEFHVKAASRLLFNSFFFLKPSISNKTENEFFLNTMNISKKLKEVLKIKFHDLEFMSKNFLFLIGKKINDEKMENFFLTFIQAFFFYFSSKFRNLEIGFKQIKKFIVVLKHMIYIEKKIFITKLSKSNKKVNFTLFLNTL